MSVCVSSLLFLSLFICVISQDIGTRIVGGASVDIKLFPYQVSIQKYGSHFCGGSLISNNTVLSAGHCFGTSIPKPPSSYSVRLGSNSTRGSGSGQSFKICSIIVHEAYSEETLDNDISVVKLCSNVSLSNEIKTINISRSTTYVSGSYANVSGYGVLKENGTSFPLLQAVSVPLLSSATCSRYYRRALITITRNMICAGYQEGGKDACQGDSGGPLTQNNILIGIVSFGVGCARATFPGIYTNVARYEKWIDKYTGNSGNETFSRFLSKGNNVILVIFYVSVIFLNAKYILI